MNQNAISDTCMFFLGACIGIIVNYLFVMIVSTYDINDRRHFFWIGMVQVLLDAHIIQYIKSKISNIGLFTLGLLAPQSLVIKRVIT